MTDLLSELIYRRTIGPDGDTRYREGKHRWFEERGSAREENPHAADCMSRFGGDCTCWLRRAARALTGEAAAGEGNTDGS